MLDKFAGELREAREKAGVNLQQIALKTRIDIKFLEAIDNGDFTFLSDPYVRAFIKEYAKVIGLDEIITLQKYEAAKKGMELEEFESSPETTETITEPQNNVQTYDATHHPVKKDLSVSLKLNLIRFAVFAGAVLLFFLIIYYLFFKSSDEIVITEKSIEEIIDENKERFEEEADRNVTDNTQSADSISLTVFSNDTSWIKIIFDDSREEEFTLFPNSQKKLRSKDNFKIIVGNSGGIKFSLDNEQLNFAGKAGTIKYVLIDSSGLSYLKNPPSLRNE